MTSISETRTSHERPIRVLYVDHCSELSGAEIALLQLIRGFSEVEPTVFLAEHGPFARLLQEEGITVDVEPLPEIVCSYRRSRGRGRFPKRFLPSILTGLARHSRILARRIQSVQPDVVHTNSAKAHIYGGLAGRLARVPVIWHLREPLAAANLGRSASLAMRLGLQVIPSAVVANSPRTARSAGRIRRPVAIVPSPIDVERFACASAAQAPRRGAHIGIVGTVAPQKGQDAFLRAFAEAFRSVPWVSAVVCGGNLFGDDAYERELRGLASGLGIAERVTFTGFVSDVERLMASLDVLVSASVRPEGLGQTVFQAMAAGVPVVATTALGACDFLTHGESALLVPPGRPRELAAAMRKAVFDEELRSRLRRQGRRVAGRFAPQHCQRQMLETYRWIVASGRARRSISTSSEACHADA